MWLLSVRTKEVKVGNSGKNTEKHFTRIVSHFIFTQFAVLQCETNQEKRVSV